MRIIRSRGFKLMLMLVSLAAVITAPRSIYDMWQRRDILRQREQARDLIAAKNDELQRKLAQAQTPEYVEEVAREKLGLIKEGETIILMTNDKSQMISENIERENIASWKKWWRLFF